MIRLGDIVHCKMLEQGKMVKRNLYLAEQYCLNEAIQQEQVDCQGQLILQY